MYCRIYNDSWLLGLVMMQHSPTKEKQKKKKPQNGPRLDGMATRPEIAP